MKLDEKRLSSEVVYSGCIFDVEKRMVQLPNDKTARRDVVVNPDATAIVAMDQDGNVIMVRQYRETAGKVLLEIPAGKMDKGEAPETCALRELREETGYRAECIKKLMATRVSPGFSTEIIHIFLATGLTAGDVDPDEDEFVEVVKMPLDELLNMVLTGQIEDGKSAAGILAAAWLETRG